MREDAEQVWPAFWMPALTRNGKRAVEVGVGEHELRRFSPKFERHRRDVAGRGFLHQRAHRDRAGEGEMPDARMGGERCARLFAEARNDIERACGKARLAREIGERKRSEAGFLCGLEHAGVAHRERRADGASGDLHRIVPRHDMAGHPVRLAQSVDGVALEIGDGFAHQFVGRAAVKLHVARHRQRIRAALLQGFADVERLDMSKLVDSFGDQFGELREQPSALSRGQLAPSAAKRLACRLDRRIDIGGFPTSDCADLDPARRVLDRQALARLRLDPASVDEALVDRKPSQRL